MAANEEMAVTADNKSDSAAEVPTGSTAPTCANTTNAGDHSVSPRRLLKEILYDLARALARQAAQEDYAAEQAREGTPPCASPSTPVSARTSRTSGR
jgi:hypothetical protein